MKLTRQKLSEYPGFFLTMSLIGLSQASVTLLIIWVVSGPIFGLPNSQDVVREYFFHGGFLVCFVNGGWVLPWLLHSRAWIHVATWIMFYLGSAAIVCIPWFAVLFIMPTDHYFTSTLPAALGLAANGSIVYVLCLVIILPICGLMGAFGYLVYLAILGRDVLDEHARKRFERMVDDEAFNAEGAMTR